jgi:hypothetical protein
MPRGTAWKRSGKDEIIYQKTNILYCYNLFLQIMILSYIWIQSISGQIKRFLSETAGFNPEENFDLFKDRICLTDWNYYFLQAGTWRKISGK